MVLKREEIMEQVKGIVGENTDDASLKFLEDLTDTFNDYDNKVKGDGTDWKAKCEEIDKEWRTKYQERFFNGGTDNHNKGSNNDPLEPDGVPDDDGEDDEPKHFEDLFTTES